jgi:hypothetical protein
MKLMASIPDDLFNRLLAAGREAGRSASTKALAQVGHFLSGDTKDLDVETCPHCGGVLRVRGRLRADLAKVVADWLVEKRAGGSQ